MARGFPISRASWFAPGSRRRRGAGPGEVGTLLAATLICSADP